ncbi:MAG: PAS domain S-box protein [Methanobacterium sp.]|nr:PAS domain S-box protein [Methanobacterium sp.]
MDEKSQFKSMDYQGLFRNDHTVMLIINPKSGRIIDANPAAVNFYGYNREELVNMSIHEINVLDPDIIDEQMLQAENKNKNHFIFKHRLADGRICDVDVYSGLIDYEGEELLYSIVHDRTDQNNALVKLRNNEELFRLIFEQSPLGACIMSLDFKPLKMNNALCNMLGYSKEELLTRKFTEDTHPDDLDMDLELRKQLVAGMIDDYHLEKRYIHFNGEIIWGNVNVSAIKDQNNRLVKILVLVEDINRQKQMEKLFLKRTDKLDSIRQILDLKMEDNEEVENRLKQLIKELKMSNQELERFAYVSSHDLKEPLRMIISFLQLLKSRYYNNLDQDANDFIDFAVEGAQRMDMMINDLLQFSRVGNERDFKYLDCEIVVRNTISNLSQLIENNDATVVHGALPKIHANEELMAQLFQNLIGNAIKYRRDVKPHISIDSSEKEEDYLFSVSDNGIGIEKQHLDRIFTVFQRLHSREEYEGTGIGLAISKKIVQQHNGKIWAKSEPGLGTTFYFTIPK